METAGEDAFWKIERGHIVPSTFLGCVCEMEGRLGGKKGSPVMVYRYDPLETNLAVLYISINKVENVSTHCYVLAQL